MSIQATFNNYPIGLDDGIRDWQEQVIPYMNDVLPVQTRPVLG